MAAVSEMSTGDEQAMDQLAKKPSVVPGATKIASAHLFVTLEVVLYRCRPGQSGP
jgi:hypothetical protein